MQDPLDSTTDSLAAAWQSANYPLPGLSALSADLQRRVTTGTRRLAATTVFEVALTVCVITAVAKLPGVFARPWATMAWGLAIAHCAIIWGFTIWNRRGIWRPLVEDTDAFLALLIVRARRRQRAARFTLGIIATEATAGVLAIAVWSPGLVEWVAQNAAVSLVMVTLVVAGVAYALRAGREARRQLDWLRQVERESA